MEILRKIKNQPPVNPYLAKFLIHCPQLQLLYIFLLNQQIPFYNELMDIFLINSQIVIQFLVMIQLIFNLSTVIYIGVKELFFFQHKTGLENLIFKIFKIKTKLLIVFSLNWNILTFKYCESLYILLALINIGFTLVQLTLQKIVNISFRFQKNTSLFQSVLIFPIICLINYYDLFYTAVFIFIRSLIQLYFNFNNLENMELQYSDYFSSLLLMSFSIVQLFSHISGDQLLDSNELYLFVIVLLLAIYGSHCLANTLIYLAPKYHLKNNQYFTKNQSQQSFLQTQGTLYINEQQQQHFILVLRILVKIYLAKIKSQKQFSRELIKTTNINIQQDQFNKWWCEFNQIIINHRVYCSNVNCLCLTLLKRSKQNDQITSQIFIDIMFQTLRKVLISKPFNNNKLQIIQKYFYIEILQKPIKNYYELMKLKTLIKKRQEILQVDSLLIQTRSLFQHIFIKQKVQNQDLQISQLLQFQNSLKDMKKQFIQLSHNYKKFYELFSNSFVQIQPLKQYTTNLISIKSVFNQQLSFHMKNFSRNLQFLSFCLIYYKYFDQYTENLEKTKKQIFNINQLSRQQLQIGKVYIDTKKIDVFDPIYGGIKIDLVSRPGEVKSITKNICQLLEFKRQQIEGQKINKVMPYMFAKNHDKYLHHFIEKGSITVLKRKQRVFYAKSSRKFIFPISVRLKVQYLSSQSFCVSALIKKTPTKAQFILLNNYGKIQQISEKLYRLLFQKSLKDQISKIKRLNLFKMILSLNQFIKNPVENDNKVYEGIISTSQNQQNLLSYYKFLQLGIGKFGKKSQNSSNSYNSEQKTSRSNSSHLSSESFGSTVDTKGFTQASFDLQKCRSDMKQMLKDYFKQLDLQKIKLYRLSYKFYDLQTSKFNCKILEIVNIKEEISQNLIRIQLSKQIVQVGQLYGFSEQQLKKFRDFEIPSFKPHSQSRQREIIQMNQLKRFNLEQQESLDESINLGQNNKSGLIQRQIQNIGSVGSSITSNLQKSQNKSSIITSFNLKTTINPVLQTSLTVLMLLASVSLVIICIFSTTLKLDYQKLQQDNIIISNFKINFEFRLAVQQLYHFYHPLSLQPPQFLVSKKHLLTDSMKEQLQNSIKWINSDLSDHFYFDQITLTHADNGFQQKRPILSTLGQIYSMFLMTEDQGQHLSDNYETIRNHLQDLSLQQRFIVLKTSQDFKIKIHVIVGIYGTILVSLVIIFLIINKISLEKQQRIMDFLPFVNVRQVDEKITFYDNLADYFKQNQEVNPQDIEIIEIQSLVEFKSSQYKKSPSIKRRNSHINGELTKSNHQKLSGKVVDKIQSNSQFIRVIKGNEKIFTLKSILIMLALVSVCLMVILETQYFFFQANNKFKAYIQLKQSAMMTQNLAPRTLLVYLINFDKIVHFEQIVIFPDQFYQNPNFQIFNLRLNLAKDQFNGTQMANMLSHHFNEQICQLVDNCDDQDIIAKGQDIYFLAYRYLNAFDYIKKVRNILPKSLTPKEDIITWANEGDIIQIFKGMEHILQLMKKSQVQIAQLFTSQIRTLGFELLYISLTLIPLLILSLHFMRQKFIHFVYNRLQSVENIYKQFSWQILADNAYALNYFDNKLKKSKKI